MKINCQVRNDKIILKNTGKDSNTESNYTAFLFNQSQVLRNQSKQADICNVLIYFQTRVLPSILTPKVGKEQGGLLTCQSWDGIGYFSARDLR